MKFNQYLTESKGKLSVENIVKTLYKLCDPYLKDTLKSKVRKFDDFMYSGRKNNKDIFTKSIRKNRRPRDSNPRVHDILDEELYREFGWSPRSEAIFTTGDDQQARNYGSNLYLIFPIGKYKFVYSNSFMDIVDILEEDIWETTYDEVEDTIDVDEGEARDLYDESYGKGEDGEWVYSDNSMGTGEAGFYDAVEAIKSNWEDFGFESEEDALDNGTNIENSLVWKPEMDWIDFWYDFKDNFYDGSEYENKVIEKTEDAIRDIAVSYVETCDDDNIVKAIRIKHEIMLGGNKYIAVHSRYKEALSSLFGEGYMVPTESKLKDWYKKQGKRFPKQLEMWEHNEIRTISNRK